MPVVLLMAAAVILVGVIVVAMGRGGEMAEFTADVRPVDTDIETATDHGRGAQPGRADGDRA